MISRDEIFDAVDGERERQDEKHKNNSMESRRESLATQCVVLGKQVGQVNAVVQDIIFLHNEPSANPRSAAPLTESLRHELYSVMAVASAILELMEAE